MQEYLKPTQLCDCENAKLKERASEIVMGVGTPREASQRIFRFVRDTIPFNATLDIYLKASQTLRKRVVDYCNKINVQVALLRAVGVPARCHLVRVEKDEPKTARRSYGQGIRQGSEWIGSVDRNDDTGEPPRELSCGENSVEWSVFR